VESKFRNYIRDLLLKNGVWSCSVEHRSGGSVGFPDTVVMVGGLLLPVELKLGRLDQRMQRMHISRLRASQIGWFEGHRAAGGSSGLLIGVREREAWAAYFLRNVRRERLKSWRAGFDMNELMCVARGDKLLVASVVW
jgi:hypothetical protein